MMDARDQYEMRLNDAGLEAPTFATTALLTVAAMAVFMLGSWALAVAPLPADRRIPASVTSYVDPEVTPRLHMPTDVAVDSTGTVYIADGARDRIVTVEADGKKVRAATTQPAGQILKRPVGVSVDAADNLWIADTDNGRLVVLSKTGQLVQTIDLPKTEAGKPSGPTDVAVTPDGKRLYVVDNLNHRILQRDAADAAAPWKVQGKQGQAVGQFYHPFMVAIGNASDVLITEAMGSRVQVITAQDRWAGAIGTWGIELGQLYRPKGIAADARGRIYVSDSLVRVIQVFDARGRIIGALTGDDGRPLYFEHPMGLCFDKAGKLYVTELRANRIAVVTLKAQEDGKP